jgi:hypothetical protein
MRIGDAKAIVSAKPSDKKINIAFFIASAPPFIFLLRYTFCNDLQVFSF